MPKATHTVTEQRLGSGRQSHTLLHFTTPLLPVLGTMGDKGSKEDNEGKELSTVLGTL